MAVRNENDDYFGKRKLFTRSKYVFTTIMLY
jgi:hypothetical protein